MFICAEFDSVTLDCLQWAQYTGLLPPLSIEEAMSLGSVTLLCWATAYSLNMLIRFLWSHTQGGEPSDD